MRNAVQRLCIRFVDHQCNLHARLRSSDCSRAISLRGLKFSRSVRRRDSISLRSRIRSLTTWTGSDAGCGFGSIDGGEAAVVIRRQSLEVDS